MQSIHMPHLTGIGHMLITCCMIADSKGEAAVSEGSSEQERGAVYVSGKQIQSGDHHRAARGCHHLTVQVCLADADLVQSCKPHDLETNNTVDSGSRTSREERAAPWEMSGSVIAPGLCQCNSVRCLSPERQPGK